MANPIGIGWKITVIYCIENQCLIVVLRDFSSFAGLVCVKHCEPINMLKCVSAKKPSRIKTNLKCCCPMIKSVCLIAFRQKVTHNEQGLAMVGL